MLAMNQFAALAEPTRRRIVETLAARGQMSATDIYQMFDVSAPAISQHLKVLREAGLVVVEKQAQRRLYDLNPVKVRELESWAQSTLDLWQGRLNRLDALLKKKMENS